MPTTSCTATSPDERTAMNAPTKPFDARTAARHAPAAETPRLILQPGMLTAPPPSAAGRAADAARRVRTIPPRRRRRLRDAHPPQFRTAREGSAGADAGPRADMRRDAPGRAAGHGHDDRGARERTPARARGTGGVRRAPRSLPPAQRSRTPRPDAAVRPPRRGPQHGRGLRAHLRGQRARPRDPDLPVPDLATAC